ncbi:MAG: diacylglycerol kinase [Paracoccaceae bacterium]|nr:diacylglycerol kinase [Paracoccaceae bacterium]
MWGHISSETRRFANTCRWSWQGWTAAWETEKSLRQWTLVNVASVVLAMSLDLTAAERAIIVALGVLILAAELFNTALEEVVDVAMPNPNPGAKKAKDCGSAGVALTAIAAGIAWGVILVF